MAIIQSGEGNAVRAGGGEAYQRMIAGMGKQIDGKEMSTPYLAENGDEILEVLDAKEKPIAYSENSGQMEVFRTLDVEEALVWYMNEHRDVHFDALRCSWDDVFGQIARARGDHEAAVSRKGNLFKYLWRKAGSEKEAIEPWLRLFPDEYGLSIVRGAIGILFHMAEKTHQREKSILEGFDTITDIIHSAMSKGISFCNEPEMHASCQALHDCIIQGVADLIWSLKRETKGHGFMEKLKHKNEKKKNIDIEVLVKTLQKKSAELDQCASRILANKTFETNQNTSDLKHEAMVTQELLAAISTKQEYHLEVSEASNADVKTLVASIQYLEAAAHGLDQTFKQGLVQLQSTLRATMSTRSPANGSQRSEALFSQLRAQNRELLLENQRLREEIQSVLTPVPRYAMVYLDIEDLLGWLDVPFGLVNDDVRMIYAQSSRITPQAQEQAQSVLRTPEYRHWLTSRSSQLLLVDGNDADATRSAVSPMSLLCAMMPAGLEFVLDAENVWALEFFCSLHMSPRDNVRGPVGMVRALVMQLVSRLTLAYLDQSSLAFGQLGGGATEEDLTNDLRSHKIDALLFAFKKLLRLVPDNVHVFCLIDGASSYETGQYAADMAYAVGELDGIVARDRMSFRVLLTCPYRSILLAPRGHIDPRDHLVVAVGGRGGLGSMSDRSVPAWMSR